MSQLRERKIVNNNNPEPKDVDANGVRPNIAVDDKQISLLTAKHWFFICFFGFVLMYNAYRMDVWLPPALNESEAGVGEFSEVRARRHLDTMSNFGPKPSGSPAAEVLTRNYIVDEIGKIKAAANSKVHEVRVGVQKPTGCFDFDFLSGFVLCYKNVTNIVAILSPSSGLADRSILVNGHFDSVPGSPGATDDLSSCAIMLEMMSILSKEPQANTHNLIFLFNGAEENFMQGAHGFITQHRLRHTIGAFVNLEGAGAGGRELLFQSGPANRWLLHAYLDAAKYPHGSVMAQEVFESGIILSDTDYRVFRDYGRLSGLDIAYVKNGYLYHTEFDKSEYIPVGSLQRAGDNVLATLRILANSECLLHPCPHGEIDVVFFDVLGLIVVQYSINVAVFLNYVVAVLVLLKILHQFRMNRRARDNFAKEKCNDSLCGYSPLNFLSQFVVHVVGALFIGITSFFAAKSVDFMDLALCWYSQPLLIFPLYVVPPILVGFSIHLYLQNKIGNLRKLSPFSKEQVTFDMSLAFLAAAVFALTCLGIRSAYFPLMLLITPLTRDVLRNGLHRLFSVKKSNVNLLYISHLISVTPGSILGSYAMIEVLTIFIPMMGRSCSKLNPEYFVSSIGGAAALIIVFFLASLLHVSRKLVYLMKCTVALILFLVAIIALTSFGAAYKFDDVAPRWRRLHLQHVNRRFLFENGSKMEDSGIWIASLDYRGVQDLPVHTFLQGSKEPYCLDEDEFCGLPYYIPLRDVVPPNSTLWLSVPNAPIFSKSVNLRLLSKERIAKNKFKFTFTVDGPDHITLFITPIKNWRLTGWTFTEHSLAHQQTYFVYLANVDVKEPWAFYLILQKNEGSEVLESDESKKLLLAASTHELHGDHQYSDTLRTILRTVSEHRREQELTKHQWKWAMTVEGWCSDYIAQYFG